MARSLSVLAQPIIGQVGWYDYRLEFTEPFVFYVGCALTAVGLTVLWAQLWSLRSASSANQKRGASLKRPGTHF
jgi:hypothetical protein